MRVDVVLRYIAAEMPFIAMFLLLSAGISYLSGRDAAFYPLLLSALVCLPLAAVEWLLPPMPMLVSLAAKGAAALAVWLLYIQFSGEYDLKGTALRLLSRKNR